MEIKTTEFDRKVAVTVVFLVFNICEHKIVTAKIFSRTS